MTESGSARAAHVLSSAESVLAADPAQVWMLVADPSRVGEWAALETIGYMGTELPRQGQVLFVRTRRWQRPAAARRVEVEEWEAGSRYRCVLEPSRSVNAATLEVVIHPEPTGEVVATRIRLMQRMEAKPQAARMVQWIVDRRLERMLDRIERATR